MDEFVVLVNDNNEELGILPKLEAHNADTPLHRGFSSYIFNHKGEFLLTQRARSKKVWPGIWTNSCCGHPAPGETVEDAVKRRLEYELGLVPQKMQLILPDFRYKVELNGIVENELCPVYFGLVAHEPLPNPLEVEAFAWIAWGTYVQNVTDNPKGYSEWSVLQVAQLQENEAAMRFIKNI